MHRLLGDSVHLSLRGKTLTHAFRLLRNKVQREIGKCKSKIMFQLQGFVLKGHEHLISMVD